jgi:hypothetical protein
MRNIKYYQQKDSINFTSYFLISTGRKSVMYALYFFLDNTEPEFEYSYIKNLSEDLEQAKRKASEFLESFDGNIRRLEDVGLKNVFAVFSDDEIPVVIANNKYNDREEDFYYLTMKSGKHEGKNIKKDLLTEDVKYVLFLMGKAKEKSEAIDEYLANGYRINPNNWSLILSKREQWLMENQNAIWEEYFRQFPKDPEPPSNWVGKPRQRMEVDLRSHKSFSFDGFYGTTYIELMKDAEGNVYKYKGSSPPRVDRKFKTFKFTVKEHETYKDQKQTVIQRIKWVPKQWERSVHQHEEEFEAICSRLDGLSLEEVSNLPDFPEELKEAYLTAYHARIKDSSSMLCEHPHESFLHNIQKEGIQQARRDMKKLEDEEQEEYLDRAVKFLQEVVKNMEK